MTSGHASDPWLSPSAQELRDRVRAFVRDVVLPEEPRAPREGHGPPAELREALQAAARTAGLLTPGVSREYGGLGLDVRTQSAVLEEAGYSLLGPPALNCAAPDEGTMHLLEVVGSDEQKERLLRPLATGSARSAFAMSEPPPGAGSDPTALRTEARRIVGGWSINGRKRFVTGAEGAAFTICMARTDDELAGARGASMFIVDAANPGMRIERRIATIDGSFAGGHAELVLDDCRVADDDVLGEIGLGFRLAQARLAPARLTHCMRWLGLARRSLDIALDYASERELFGAGLDQLGIAQAMIADCVIDLDASRGLIRRGAEALDAGDPGRHESGVAKVFVAEAVGRVVDRAMQLCGGSGMSHDLPLARFAAELRPFRVYDGPSETHRMAIAQRAVRRRASARRDLGVADTASEAAALRRAPLLVRRPLEQALDAAGLGTGALVASPIGSGHSNVTLRIVRNGLDAVLRRPPRPPLAPSAHDVLREARVLHALAATAVRVPRVLYVHAGAAPLGVPFFVMERAPGEEVTERLPDWLATPEARAVLADDLVETLCEVHAVDWRASALGQLARHDGYLERQLRRFRELLAHTRTRPLPRADELAERLERLRPVQRETTLVHGDFRLGNVLALPGPVRISALLDWELATLGDPLADLGYLAATWSEPGSRGNALELSPATRAPGFPTRAELVARYAERSGRESADLPWYMALALWKGAIFLEGNYRRLLAGSTDDPYYRGLDVGVPELLEEAWELVR
ncbi:MAG: acyl-CoA dehydrogenase [Gaiellales bacterium]|nr:acyl-CoA dehydrogenase [Gaiellales bacterium]